MYTHKYIYALAYVMTTSITLLLRLIPSQTDLFREAHGLWHYLFLSAITANEGSDFTVAPNGSGQPQPPIGSASSGAAYQLILGRIYAFKGRGSKVQAPADGLSDGSHHPLAHPLEKTCTMGQCLTTQSAATTCTARLMMHTQCC